MYWYTINTRLWKYSDIDKRGLIIYISLFISVKRIHNNSQYGLKCAISSKLCNSLNYTNEISWHKHLIKEPQPKIIMLIHVLKHCSVTITSNHKVYKNHRSSVKIYLSSFKIKPTSIVLSFPLMGWFCCLKSDLSVDASN